MNNIYELCNNCPVQCRLEETSEQIVTLSKGMTMEQIGQRISTMSLEATKRPCPPREIFRMRKSIAERINPKALYRYVRDYNTSIVDDAEKLPNHDIRLPSEVANTKDSLKKVKVKNAGISNHKD